MCSTLLVMKEKECVISEVWELQLILRKAGEKRKLWTFFFLPEIASVFALSLGSFVGWKISFKLELFASELTSDEEETFAGAVLPVICVSSGISDNTLGAAGGAEQDTVSYIWFGGVSVDSRGANGARDGKDTVLGMPLIRPGTIVLDVSKTSLWASSSRNQLSSSSSSGADVTAGDKRFCPPFGESRVECGAELTLDTSLVLAAALLLRERPGSGGGKRP